MKQSRARKHRELCEIGGCGEAYYARNMCKPHYMQELRGKYKAATGNSNKAPTIPFNMDDYWEFVKKELQLQ